MSGRRLGERVLVRSAGVLSLGASAVHAAVIDTHLEEWWGYGVFFIVASILQGLYGLVLLALPERPAWDPHEWLRWKRRLFWMGILGNLSIIALYTITRTPGVPLFGPEAGQVEAVETIDLVSKAIEMALVGCLALILALRANRVTTRQAAPQVAA